MISIRDLHYRWPRAGADTLAIGQLDIAQGEAVMLLGPSGCGKSTLLGLLAGVLVASAGQVRVRGQDWSALRPAARDALRAAHLGVVFQQFNLLPYLPVLDNVLLPCRVSAARAARATPSPREEAARLLERIALPSSLWTRPAADLSVGQQQRVAAARALIGAPSLILADEPTSALDSALRDHFMDLLLGECHARGCTLVFVSHDDRLTGRFGRRLSLPELNRAAAHGGPDAEGAT